MLVGCLHEELSEPSSFSRGEIEKWIIADDGHRLDADALMGRANPSTYPQRSTAKSTGFGFVACSARIRAPSARNLTKAARTSSSGVPSARSRRKTI